MPEPPETWDTGVGPEQGRGAQWGYGQGLASSRHQPHTHRGWAKNE